MTLIFNNGSINGGGGGSGDSYTKAETNALLSVKASTSLDNLSSAGQMIVDSVDGKISNCILEIPQNIKLTLENNVLTLKAGSILTLTGETYATVTTQQDIVWTSPDSNTYGKRCYILATSTPNQSGFGKRNVLENVSSGSSLPETVVDGSLFFNTTDKLIYQGMSGVWTARNFVYPLGLVDIDNNGNMSFAKDSNGNDMIFNGAGFIGHHAFVYPNVVLLRPNKKNTEERLQSNYTKTNAVIIQELNSNFHIATITGNATTSVRPYIEVDILDTSDTSHFQYSKFDNVDYFYNGSSWVERFETPFVEYSYNGTTVTDFTIRQPVRLATTEMLDKVQSQVDTNTTAISGKQDTLVSGTNIKTINSTTVLGSGNFTLADQSLSNLDSTGQMVVDSQNGTISNCILEIPQNLKLTIEGGVFTVKAGSVVVVANGDTYTTQNVNSDVSRDFSDWGGDGLFYVMYRTNNTLTLYPIAQTGSGATLPEDGTTYNRFYLTTDKKIYEYYNDIWNFSPSCYPLCVVEKTGTSLAFVKDSKGRDLIFNGCGFIGHHMFEYPNLSGLSPNRYNADGSLASTQTKSNSLIIKELSQNATDYVVCGLQYLNGHRKYHIVDNVSDVDTTETYSFWYIKNENITGYVSGGAFVVSAECLLLTYSTTGTTVTKFDIRQPYEGARNLLTDELQADVTTLTGYDSTQTQTLKNINGVLQWVTD